MCRDGDGDGQTNGCRYRRKKLSRAAVADLVDDVAAAEGGSLHDDGTTSAFQAASGGVRA